MGSIPVAGANNQGRSALSSALGCSHLKKGSIPSNAEHLKNLREGEFWDMMHNGANKGSIPVAGAKTQGRRLLPSPLCFGIASQTNPSPQAKRSGMGFAYPARRSASSLGRRRARVSSPTARFPPGVPLLER